MRVDVATGQATEVPLPYERVNDLASFSFAGGERILLATSSDKGKRSQLLVISAQSLAPLGRVEIPGNGEHVVVSPDGYSAYVLSHRPTHNEDTDPSSGAWELLWVDLGKSSVAMSYPLAGPGYDLAMTPDGRRILLAQDDKIQTFTTSPLAASWFFRSPGKNRRLAVRPRQGQIYSLRDSSLAIFPPEPKPPSPAGTRSPEDDASKVLEPPVHVDRIGFSADGRMAVAAGRAMDVLVVVDAVRMKLAGTWPEDSGAVASLLLEIDAAERPKGPRGRLLAHSAGFAPPLGGTGTAPSPQGETASESPQGRSSEGKEESPHSSSATPPDLKAQALPPTSSALPAPANPQAPQAHSGEEKNRLSPSSPPPQPDRKAQASPPGMTTPPPEATASEGKPFIPPGATSTGPGSPAPEVASLEEVSGEFLKGKIFGDLTDVSAVLLYGPNSLTTLRNQATPASDGTFSFKLPPAGKYRILLGGKAGKALATRPAFQTLDVGAYGFAGIDFTVLGVHATSSH